MSAWKHQDPAHGCNGKRGFDSAILAHDVVKRRSRAGKPCKAYRCPHCGKWHIASSGTQRRP